jgi:hypothetical protein
MNMHYNRFLFALLCIILFCSAAQATNLQLSVVDNLDNTSISGATVFQNSVIVGQTDGSGQFLIVHPGLVDQDIKVSMLGYNDWEQTIDKNATSVLVNMTRQTLTMGVKLYDVGSSMPIPGANVSISSADNITQMKTTDSTGSVRFGVQATTLYSIDITAPNYLPRNETVNVETDSKDVQYLLLSENQFLFIVTDKDSGQPIPGAEIRLNNILDGVTDSQGVLSITVSRGNYYTIAITKTGYEMATESRTIEDTDSVYTATLSQSPVGAYIDVFDENHLPLSDVNISINGAVAGSTNQYGRANFPNLLAGIYQVEVTKTGYGSISRPITVSNQSEDYTFEMPFESAALTILAQDTDQNVVPNATIILNNNFSGLTDNHGKYVANVEFNTPYNITLSKEGYQSISVQKEIIVGNGTASVTITLEKNVDWGLIALVAIGAVCVLLLFAAIRMFGRRKRRHVTRRNEI